MKIKFELVVGRPNNARMKPGPDPNMNISNLRIPPTLRDPTTLDNWVTTYIYISKAIPHVWVARVRKYV